MTSDRLRFALPFDVLVDAGSVHLVAGEDFRVSLHDLTDPSWTAALMLQLRRGVARSELYSDAHPAAQVDALLDQLIGERVIVVAPLGEAAPRGEAEPSASNRALDAITPVDARVVSSGNALSKAVEACVERSALREAHTQQGAAAPERVEVFCQDDLNYAAALAYNRAAKSGAQRWLWASSGPRGRAFVGPVFLPSAGPCFACILEGFRRLSEAPELYAALIHHTQAGGQLCASGLAPQQLRLVADLVVCKLAAYQARQSSAYQLHVLELGSLEVTSFELWAEPECSECRAR